jgi:hypothetical protein
MTSGDYRMVPVGRCEPSVCYDAIAGRRNEACERAILHTRRHLCTPSARSDGSTTKGGSDRVDIDKS